MQTLKNILTWIWTNVLSRNILLAAFVGVVILFTVQQCGLPSKLATYEKAIAAWEKQAKDAETTAAKDSGQIAALQKQNAVLQVQNDSIGKERSKLAMAADAQKKRADSALALIKVPSVSAASCASALAHLDSIANQLDVAYNTLDTAFVLANTQIYNDSLQHVNDQRSLLLAETANDSLRAALLKVPVYKQEKLLNFITLPSRKASFGIGAAVGAAAVLVIQSHIK